jgi:hypothetical protein
MGRQSSYLGHTPPSAQVTGKFLQSLAVIDCLKRAEKWLDTYANTELATVVHEDGT